MSGNQLVKSPVFPRLFVTALLLLFGLMLSSQVPAEEHPDARGADLDANPFHLDPAGQSLLSSGTGQVLGHLEYNTILDAGYLFRPLIVRGEDGEWLRSLIDSRVQLDLSGAIGLWHRLELGFVLPFIAFQDAEFPGQKLEEVTSMGLGHVGVYLKGTILAAADFPVALSLSLPVWMPTADSTAYMGFDGWGIEPRLSISGEVGPVLMATTLGYLLQPETQIFDLVDDDKITFRAGIEYHLEEAPVDFAVEFSGATQVEDVFNSETTSGELVAGLRYGVTDTFDLHAGLGRGLVQGMPSPAVRVFLGMSYRGGGREHNEDPDGDGILGWDDDCPSDAEDRDGFEDEDGCPDLDDDDDGIPDREDACPTDQEDFDGVDDLDGCPDLDNDADGIFDVDDQCPDDPEDIDLFEDEDGCPDLDNDADGILDEADECPMDPENFDGIDDEDGCPDEELLVEEEEEEEEEAIAVIVEDEIVINQQIKFEFETTQLSPDSEDILREVLRILESHEEMRVRIEGHTDSIGTLAFNRWLSQARADSVRSWLVDNAQTPDEMVQRLDFVGFGEGRPIENNLTAHGRAANRRVEFHIIEQDPGGE